MKEFELKYGCNPNQKPARVFMADGSDLPLPSFPAGRGTSIFWTPSTATSWSKS